jgi:toxin ParE1/3/4
MSKVQVTAPAKVDRFDILTSLAEKSGTNTAERYKIEFREWFHFLTHTPEGGAPRPRLGKNMRIVVVDPYLVIYHYDPEIDTVRILRIVHGKRRISARLLKGTDQWDA